jgi:uncharacterized protein (TIGR02466 family)
MPLENWFPTPIYYSMIEGRSFDDIQRDFNYVIDELEKSKSFNKNPNWDPHTHKITNSAFNKDLVEEYKLISFYEELSKHLDIFMKLVGTPINKVKKFKITESWLTKTSRGEYAHNHTHGSSDISGVYYVKTNQKDGSIFFNSPVGQLTHSYCFEDMPANASYVPVPGKLILFPSWLDHGVRENTTDSERISFSFNISFDRE